MKRIVQRKRRNGQWYSMGQGDGGVGTGTGGANDDGGDDDDGDDDDDSEDDDDDDSGSDDKDKKKIKKVVDDPEKARLIAENKRRRVAARESRQRAETAERELNDLKGKDKPEVDRLKGENETLKTRAETAESRLNVTLLSASFYRAAMVLGVDPTQLEFAEFKFGKHKIDVEEAGDDLDDEVEAALKSVIAETPTLVPKKRGRPKSESSDDDEDDDDEDDGKTGRTAPVMNNGRKKPGKETDEQRRARLAKKFPALQGRH